MKKKYSILQIKDPKQGQSLKLVSRKQYCCLICGSQGMRERTSDLQSLGLLCGSHDDAAAPF
jgi:hypothetical protein